MNTPTVVITHHALSRTHHTVKDVDQWHKERWPGFISRKGYHVGYHYVVEWDGTVTQTREHDEEGAHVIGMNKKSIGVCFMGNFDNHLPSEAQMMAWNKLYGQLRKQYPDIPTKPHRAYSTKSCHGRLLEDTYFQTYHQRTELLDQLRQMVALLTHLLTLKRMK